jgi:hypothetical protein
MARDDRAAEGEADQPINDGELLDRMRKTSIKSAVEQLRLIQRVKEGVDDACAPPGPCGPPPGSDTGEPLLRRFMFDAARVQLENYDRLLGLSTTYSDRFVDSVRALLRSRPGGVGYVPAVLVETSGPAGGTAVGRFLVENKCRTTTKVEFSVSEFRDVAGGEPFGARVSFTAQGPTGDDSRCLPPGTPRVFTATVDLLAPFAAGHAYMAVARVTVGERPYADITLRVEVRPADGSGT